MPPTMEQPIRVVATNDGMITYLGEILSTLTNLADDPGEAKWQSIHVAYQSTDISNHNINQ